MPFYLFKISQKDSNIRVFATMHCIWLIVWKKKTTFFCFFARSEKMTSGIFLSLHSFFWMYYAPNVWFFPIFPLWINKSHTVFFCFFFFFKINTNQFVKFSMFAWYFPKRINCFDGTNSMLAPRKSDKKSKCCTYNVVFVYPNKLAQYQYKIVLLFSSKIILFFAQFFPSLLVLMLNGT